ncbi:tail assembly protein [Roseibium aggregatum]|uniref:Phage-related protein, tail component n=1 Tax=Roseibium aggregatum TaxID=187304 RepID=A0A0M6Y6P1_9HYPH|nr:tail assembly protein [Roseibium aggregatum]CTQ45776.1 Phage-related protein, tail component [Roseibium aggregatum]
MLRTVYLHGKLAKEFGKKFEFDANDIAEIGRALNAVVPGFRKYAIDRHFRIVRGNLKSGFDIDESQLTLSLGNTSEIHIFPAVKGSGGNNALLGIVKVVAGIALLGVGYFLLGGTLATVAMGLGASLALSGVASLLTPQVPQQEQREEPGNQNSHLFNGATNTTRQGAPVPLVYGKMRTGSHVASAGITLEEIPV